MCNRLNNVIIMFFTGKNSAFKKNTQLSMQYCIQLIKFTVGLKKNLHTQGIFIDLSKAFDTVDYKILITKFESYGVKGTNLRWFKSYLENRKKFIGYEKF